MGRWCRLGYTGQPPLSCRSCGAAPRFEPRCAMLRCAVPCCAVPCCAAPRSVRGITFLMLPGDAGESLEYGPAAGSVDPAPQGPSSGPPTDTAPSSLPGGSGGQQRQQQQQQQQQRPRAGGGGARTGLPCADVAVAPAALRRMLSQLLDGVLACAAQVGRVGFPLAAVRCGRRAEPHNRAS